MFFLVQEQILPSRSHRKQPDLQDNDTLDVTRERLPLRDMGNQQRIQMMFGGPGVNTRIPSKIDPDYDPTHDPNSDEWKKEWRPREPHGHEPDDVYTDEKNPKEKLDDLQRRFQLSEEAKNWVHLLLTGTISVAIFMSAPVSLSATVVLAIVAYLGLPDTDDQI